MRTIHYAACVIIVSLCVVAVAHGQWREGADEVPDTAWSKHKGEFGAMLLLSDKPEEFLEAWDQPTDGVPIQTTETVTRGVPIVAFVIFAGCMPDDEGLCNASVDFIVSKPDGSEYAAFMDKDLWKNKPAFEKNALQLSADYVGVIIDPDDPLGKYQVRTTVRDLNAGLSFDLSREFKAIEGHQLPKPDEG